MKVAQQVVMTDGRCRSINVNLPPSLLLLKWHCGVTYQEVDEACRQAVILHGYGSPIWQKWVAFKTEYGKYICPDIRSPETKDTVSFYYLFAKKPAQPWRYHATLYFAYQVTALVNSLLWVRSRVSANGAGDPDSPMCWEEVKVYAFLPPSDSVEKGIREAENQLNSECRQ